MKSTIPIDKALIDPHPDNPRKDLGDLDELIESIRMNGILQNLTVIPQDDEWTRFTCLIGHRRLAASKQISKIKEVPCIIVEDLTRNEQIAIMLEENMQRNDLTIVEQAESFQMMLDLGETIETIGDKTGFSETTIRHRLQIAKLDRELLHDEDRNYQFQMKDYIKLEEVDDIEERNKILATGKNSADIIWKVNTWKRVKTRDKNRKELMKLLKEAGIKKAPNTVQLWRPGVDDIKKYNLDDGGEITLPEIKDQKNTFWIEDYSFYVHIVHAVPEKTTEREKTEQEIKKERTEKNRKKLRELQKAQEKERKSFINDLIRGDYKYPEKDREKWLENDMWTTMMAIGDEFYLYPGAGMLAEHISGYDKYEKNEDWQRWKKKVMEMKPLFQKLITIDRAFALTTGTGRGELAHYDGTRNKRTCEWTKVYYNILMRLGFQPDEEFMKILDGDSELFEEEKKEEG